MPLSSIWAACWLTSGASARCRCGAAALVQAVSAQVTVACLSNTNAVHLQAGAPQWPLLVLLEHNDLNVTAARQAVLTATEVQGVLS